LRISVTQRGFLLCYREEEEDAGITDPEGKPVKEETSEKNEEEKAVSDHLN